MKKLENLIILVLVCSGAVLLYQKLDSMGPESEPQSPPSQKETVVAETKPAAPETPAQPAATTPAPAPAETGSRAGTSFLAGRGEVAEDFC